MEIGKRLQQLRNAKGISQGDLEHRTGLLRCYVSRVENGHTTPSLAILERWAEALDLELYQIFFVGDGQPEAPALPESTAPTGTQERKLAALAGQMPADDKALLISIARDLAKRNGKRG